MLGRYLFLVRNHALQLLMFSSLLFCGYVCCAHAVEIGFAKATPKTLQELENTRFLARTHTKTGADYQVPATYWETRTYPLSQPGKIEEAAGEGLQRT